MSAETIRLKIHVNVAGFRPNQVADVRKGYGEMLVKVGYATRLDNLADAISAEPSRYGDWEDDPRSVADDPEFPNG